MTLYSFAVTCAYQLDSHPISYMRHFLVTVLSDVHCGTKHVPCNN